MSTITAGGLRSSAASEPSFKYQDTDAVYANLGDAFDEPPKKEVEASPTPTHQKDTLLPNPPDSSKTPGSGTSLVNEIQQRTSTAEDRTTVKQEAKGAEKVESAHIGDPNQTTPSPATSTQGSLRSNTPTTGSESSPSAVKISDKSRCLRCHKFHNGPCGTRYPPHCSDCSGHHDGTCDRTRDLQKIAGCPLCFPKHRRIMTPVHNLDYRTSSTWTARPSLPENVNQHVIYPYEQYPASYTPGVSPQYYGPQPVHMHPGLPHSRPASPWGGPLSSQNVWQRDPVPFSRHVSENFSGPSTSSAQTTSLPHQPFVPSSRFFSPVPGHPEPQTPSSIMPQTPEPSTPVTSSTYGEEYKDGDDHDKASHRVKSAPILDQTGTFHDPWENASSSEKRKTRQWFANGVRARGPSWERSRSLSTDSSAPQPVATATSPRSESPSVTQAPPNVVPATDIIHRTSKPALSDEQKYSELQSTQMKVTSPHLAPAIELCISEKVSSEKAEEMLTPAPDNDHVSPETAREDSKSPRTSRRSQLIEVLKHQKKRRYMQKLLPDQKAWGPCTPSTSPRSWSKVLDPDLPMQMSDQKTAEHQPSDLSSSSWSSDQNECGTSHQMGQEAGNEAIGWRASSSRFETKTEVEQKIGHPQPLSHPEEKASLSLHQPSSPGSSGARFTPSFEPCSPHSKQKVTGKDSETSLSQAAKVRDPYEGLGDYFAQKEAGKKDSDILLMGIAQEEEVPIYQQHVGHSNGKMAAKSQSTYTQGVMPGERNRDPAFKSKTSGKLPMQGHKREDLPVVRLPTFTSRNRPPVHPVLVSTGITLEQRNRLKVLGLLADAPKVFPNVSHSDQVPHPSTPFQAPLAEVSKGGSVAGPANDRDSLAAESKRCFELYFGKS